MIFVPGCSAAELAEKWSVHTAASEYGGPGGETLEGEHDPKETGPSEPAGLNGMSVGEVTLSPAAQPEPQPQPDQPVSAPMSVPSAFAPRLASKRGGSPVLLVGAIVAAFLILGLGGGAALANASLSSTYSPKRAVTDYFAAQARGDVNTMMSNATFVPGAASDEFFNKDAVTAMMALDPNRAISAVAVTSTQDLDSSTSTVTVSMTWNDTQRTQTYMVRKDTRRVHDLFYYSWRVDIPSTTIQVTLPNQAGVVQVDGISASSPSSVPLIQGYHTVTMLKTDLYDEASQTANAVDGTAAITFPSKLGSRAMAAAAASIKAAFGKLTCDASKYDTCPNHAYKVPAGYYYNIDAPGGVIRANTSWSATFTGDPTAGMELVITNETDKVTASGKCSMMLTVDGSRTYNFTGTWTGTLTWFHVGFASNLSVNCALARA